MKVRKAIKKVAAIGLGASMLGATVMGAVAADLSDYPSPLVIQDGVFNGVIVLGDNAISSDTLGAIDIATGLQFSSTTASSGSGAVVTISDGSSLGSSGNDLNIGEAFASIEGDVDNSELPTVLGDGVFDESEGSNDNDEQYDQEITWGSAAGTLQLDQDDSDAPDGGLYLFTDNSAMMYNYTLEFDNEVDYDSTSDSTAEDDFETAKIDIQGNTYTIVNVKLSSSVISELKLQAGDTTVWLEQDNPITRIIGGEEHEVELVDVNENEDKCGILIDGSLEWLDTGSSETINGVEVGVTEAISVHSEAQDTDVCEVNLGATEITLKEGDEVEINGKEVDGSEVEFIGSAGALEEFSIWYEPEDEIYLGPGDTWADPVLGNWEITFASLVAKEDVVTADVSGDDFTVTFMNSDGKEIVLPFFCDGSCDATNDNIYFGTDSDDDEQYYFEGDSCAPASSDVQDCEGARFLVNEGDEVHVIEISDIDVNDNETTLKDITYGGEKTEDFTPDGAVDALDLPAGGANVYLTIGHESLNFTHSDSGDDIINLGDDMETMYEGLLSIERNGTNNGANNNTIIDGNSTFKFVFDESDGDTDGSGADDSRGTISFNITRDISDDEELNVRTPVFSDATYGSVDFSDSNDDDQLYYSDYGTKVVHDDEDKRSLVLTFPGDELYANVFISPVGANVVTAQSAESVNVQKIEVGTAKLASEVGSFESQNTIVVGGPCANAKAAEFLGVTASNCLEGAPEENTAVVSLKEYGENVALLVNGYGAMDTRRAARVLANYDDYTLSGEEVVVTGTDFTNIQVSTV